MALSLEQYERTEEFIGVSIPNPSSTGDLHKAWAVINQRFESYTGELSRADSITIRADEDRIYLEFAGCSGSTGWPDR